MNARPVRGVGALAAIFAMLFLSSCKDFDVEIKQNDLGNYIYEPRLVDLSATTANTVTFKDTANVAAHMVEIWGPGANPAAPRVLVASGRVMPGGQWSHTFPANSYPAGTHLSVNEPATAGGAHSTEHGTLRF